MKLKVGIIDYGLGNIHSLKEACVYLGFETYLINNKIDLNNVDKIILPGVGSFNTAINNLNKLNLFESLKNIIVAGKPILGICLGMQLLMEESTEFGITKGLGLIKGTTRNFNINGLRSPNIGWNQIKQVKESIINHNINFENEVFFIHSYYVVPENESDILFTTKYGEFEYCAAFNQNKIYGFQFHPEKSGTIGLELLDNFLKE
jgi:glutamine amidotransferase